MSWIDSLYVDFICWKVTSHLVVLLIKFEEVMMDKINVFKRDMFYI